MILPIYVDPQPVLRQVAEPVPEVTDEIRQLILNMRETMHNAEGVGLAAPQIGHLLSMFVAEIKAERAEDAYDEILPFTAFINPEIIWRSPQKSTFEEACLSIPGVMGMVKRPRKVTVRYLDEKGNRREMTADGLLARIIQHECDHLKGVLFTDYVPENKRTKRDTPDYPRI